MNMFGYDDDQLNQILFGLAQDPTIMVQVTLDKSQASGAHEKAILASDEANDPTGYAADFAVGESDTHQISHTKGGVLDGVIAFEGSTNWSGSGEGTGIDLKAAVQHPGFKAQNNTLSVYVNPYEIAKFLPGSTTNTASPHIRCRRQPQGHSHCKTTPFGLGRSDFRR
jgi:hypothetical protein